MEKNPKNFGKILNIKKKFTNKYKMSSLLSAFFKTMILPKLMTEGKFRVDKAFFYSVAGLYALYGIMRANGWLPKKSVNGKHIFITGAGSGIGK